MVPTLNNLLANGVNVYMWAGDADWICSWYGNRDSANALSWVGANAFFTTNMQDYTVNGTSFGKYKSVQAPGGPILSFMVAYGAGHKLSWYGMSLN